MQRPVIDEIYKNALLKWEEGNDTSADLAKERVWQAVNKPRQTRKTHWAFISSAAAALVMLLVSGFLFLKLDHKQKELIALQEKLDRNTAIPIKPKVENLAKDDPKLKPEEVQREEKVKEVPNENPDKKPPSDQRDNFAGITPEKLQPIEPIQGIRMEVLEPILVLERDDFPAELTLTSLISPKQKIEGDLPQPASKIKPKLKVGLGKGKQPHSPQNTLAINIKI